MKKIFIFLFFLAFLSSVNGACIVSINDPDNNYYTEYTTPVFNYSIVGSSATYICGLVIDGIETNTANVTNNTDNTHTPAVLDIEEHTWYINCTVGAMACLSPTRNIDIGNMKYEGINDMRKFVEDLAGVLIVMLPLTVVVIMLAVVFKFRDVFKKFTKK